MNLSFADALCEAVQRLRSATCVGIDPRADRLPAALRISTKDGPEARAAAVEAFARGVVEAVADLVPAVKVNIAFFEALGPQGLLAYREVTLQARELGLLVIGDGKRGDIGSTAEAYAAGHLAEPRHPAALGAHDAVTVNPYLGADGVLPFIEAARANGQGVFVLVKTSNPSSAEIQELALREGGTVAERVASLVNDWGAALVGASGLSSVGAVVGATHRQDLARLRALMPRAPFLLPGFGAQGASAEDVTDAFLPGGLGGLVNASRSIVYAYEKEGTDDFAGAARSAAKSMNAAMRLALERAGKGF
ncbi:MAG: orotidine-5'-phosphate decarboxylase [Planctomycetota bacterium]